MLFLFFRKNKKTKQFQVFPRAKKKKVLPRRYSAEWVHSISDFVTGPNTYVYWTPVVTDTCHRLGCYVVLKRDHVMIPAERNHVAAVFSEGSKTFL